MPGPQTEALFTALGRVREQWPKRGWTWDGRLSCVASAFGMDLVQDARQALAHAFPEEWTQRTIGRAPPLVQELANGSGGVRPDQLVFSAPAAEGLVSYGLWWPWGDETTITLRIGITGVGAVRQEFRLREVFNALD